MVVAYYVTTRTWWMYHDLADHRTTARPARPLASLWWWRVFRWWERGVTGPVPHTFRQAVGQA